MLSFIEELQKYNNKLLKNEAKGIELFKDLKHDKQGLELLLKHVVAEILTSSKKRLLCTSNEELVKKFSAVKTNGASLLKVMHVPFKTSPKHNTLTWDLLKNKYASIAGNNWQILNFIVIDETNADILHSAITDLLKRVR